MSKISQITYSDLTGGINNVDSKDTINNTPKKTQTPEMVNVEYFKLGGIKSMEGNEIVSEGMSIQEAPVIAGWEYIKGNQRYMMIGLSNGSVKIFDDTLPDGGDFREIFKFTHNSDRMSFCNMNNGVVITNGIDDLMFYEKGRRTPLTGDITIASGSTDINGTNTRFIEELKPGDTIYVETTHQPENPDDPPIEVSYVVTVANVVSDTLLTITEPAEETITNTMYYLSELSACNAILKNTDPEGGGSPDTPIRGLAIQYYNGRLWVGGENGLFYSQTGQYNKWDIYYDAGVIYSIYNDTSKITALGLFSEYLIVHKELSTYILTMNGAGETISIKPFSNITCDSQQSWIVSNTKYFVYSREYLDIYPLVQHTTFSDKFLGEPISQKVRNAFLNVRQPDSDKIFCVSRPKARQMMFYMPTNDVLGSSFAMIYDFQTKSWLCRKVMNTDVTCAFNYKNNVYIGTRDGLVLKEFTSHSFKGLDSDNNIIEISINAVYKTPWFDWVKNYNQSFAEFIVEIANDFRNNFVIRTQKDGQSRTEDRVIDSDALAGTALIWEGIYDDEDNTTTWDNDNWVKATFESIRMLLPNNVFEDFQLEITTPEVGQSFAIYEFGFRRIEYEEAPW